MIRSFEACYRIPSSQEPPRLGSCATIRLAGEKAWNVRVVGLAVDKDADEIEVQLGGKPEPVEVGPVTEGVGRRMSGYTPVQGTAGKECVGGEEGAVSANAPFVEPYRNWNDLISDPGFAAALQEFLARQANPGINY